MEPLQKVRFKLNKPEIDTLRKGTLFLEKRKGIREKIMVAMATAEHCICSIGPGLSTVRRIKRIPW